MSSSAISSAELTSDTDVNVARPGSGGRGIRSAWARFRRLPVDIWLEPVIIVVVGASFAIWHSLATFSPNEDAQLNASVLTETIWAHIVLTVTAAVIVLAIAVPLGIALTRPSMRRFTPFAIGLGNIGQAAPAVGLLVILTFALGTGWRTAALGLVIYAVLPILQNTIIGLQQVDSNLVEASRGIGFSARRTLFQVELPLAVPVILNGVRTALVILVGTATLSTFIGATSLGTLITTGITVFLPRVMIAGAVLVALLALTADWLGRLVEHFATPKGMR